MIRTSAGLLCLAVLATAAVPRPKRNVQRDSVDELLDAAKRGGADGSVIYRAPGRLRRVAEGVFFGRVLSAARAADREALRGLQKVARALDFKIVLTNDRYGRPVAVVVEEEFQPRGAGAYVVRIGPAGSEAFVQAPHTFSDLMTRPLAMELFSTLDARVLGVSTVHRRGKSGLGSKDDAADSDKAPPRGHADLAHAEESTFQIVTLAWLAERTGAPLVQLHGYANARAPADAVLSAGTQGPTPPWLHRIAGSLREAFPGSQIAVYPDESAVLGGLTNVQARAASARGARFVHVELAASFRQAVRSDAESTRRFVTALASALVFPGSIDDPSDT